MRHLILVFGLAALLMPRADHGRNSAAPNDAGVTMGSLHLVVQDVDTYRKFFITLGGAPVAQGMAVKFPGVVVFFTKGDPDGGTVGSVVNHFAFSVPSTPDALAKWNAAGLKTEVGSLPGQGYVHTPDDLSSELKFWKTRHNPCRSRFTTSISLYGRPGSGWRKRGDGNPGLVRQGVWRQSPESAEILTPRPDIRART